MSNNSEKVTRDIFIVDDTLANLKVLSETLTSHGYEVRGVQNGKSALKAIKTMTPSLILLDINMPEMDGYQVCQALKADETTCHIPIIFLTASHNAQDKVKAFACGGVDYIAKPFQIEEVLARVKNQLDIQAAYARIRLLNEQLETQVQEKTKFLRQKLNELETTKKILHDTFYDPLTDLPNRTSLAKHLEQAMLEIRKDKNYGFVILFIECLWQDIKQSESNFTEQKLILAVVKRILSSLREVDTLTRVGSRKFVALLPEIQNIHRATYIAEQIHQKFAQPLNITRQEIAVNASIGIVLGSKNYKQYAHILKNGQIAARQAQKKGKNHYHLFSETTTSAIN